MNKEDRELRKDSSVKTPFIARNDLFNLFTCTIGSVEDCSEPDLAAAVQQGKENFLAMWKKRIPRATLDTSTNMEMIGGKEFEDYGIIIRVGDKILFNCHLYSGMIKNYMVIINTTFNKEIIGEKLMICLRE
jgi:hypothetical protein